MPTRVDQWLASIITGLGATEQKEMARKVKVVGKAFAEFDTAQVEARHVLQFINHWTAQGKLRMAQSYRSMLNQFFKWVIVQGDRSDNPVEPVKAKAPRSRSRYITDAEFIAIRAHLEPMMMVYVDLLYLTGQRNKDIRTLRWQQIDEMIHFQPSKTMHSTAVKVDIPITPQLAEVLARAKELMLDASRLSPFVIHRPDGTAYNQRNLRWAWDAARAKTDVRGCTLRDIRPKHATDAEKAGHSVEEISQGLAHADSSMTRTYLKQRVAKVGVVSLKLPK
jgi:integrase